MQLNTLKTFIALSDNRSFSKTSRQFYVTQSALSQQISKLEEELGFPLIERNRSARQFLTPAGLIFYDYAKRTIKDHEYTIIECRKAMEKQEHLRLSLEPSTTRLLSSNRLDEYRVSFPNAPLAFKFSSFDCLVRDLLEDRADLVLLPEPDRLPKNTVFHHLCTDRYVAIMRRNHPLAAQTHLSLSSLTSTQVILPDASIWPITDLKRKLQSLDGIQPESYEEFNPRVMTGTVLFITNSLYTCYLREDEIAIPLDYDYGIPFGFLTRIDGRPEIEPFLDLFKESETL